LALVVSVGASSSAQSKVVHPRAGAPGSWRLLGPFPASYQAGLGVFPVHPDIGPTWKLRAAIVLLSPRARR